MWIMYEIMYEINYEKVRSVPTCIWLFAIPQTISHQASPSMIFSRQEYWSGLPFPSPVQKDKCAKFREDEKKGRCIS